MSRYDQIQEYLLNFHCNYTIINNDISYQPTLMINPIYKNDIIGASSVMDYECIPFKNNLSDESQNLNDYYLFNSTEFDHILLVRFFYHSDILIDKRIPISDLDHQFVRSISENLHNGSDSTIFDMIGWSIDAIVDHLDEIPDNANYLGSSQNKDYYYIYDYLEGSMGFTMEVLNA